MIKKFLQWIGLMKKPKPIINVPDVEETPLEDRQKRKDENQTQRVSVGVKSTLPIQPAPRTNSSINRVNSSGSVYGSPQQKDTTDDGFINGAATGYAFSSMMHSTSFTAPSPVSSPAPAPAPSYSRSDSDCSSYSYSSYDSSSSSCDSSSSSDW